VSTFASESDPRCSTYGHIIVESREVENSEEDRKGETTSNNLARSGTSSQGQLQSTLPHRLLDLASFSKHKRWRTEIRAYNDPNVACTFPQQTTAMLDSKEASMVASINAEARASTYLDQFFEAAGFTFNR
jgi:hypothetical protein